MLDICLTKRSNYDIFLLYLTYVKILGSEFDVKNHFSHSCNVTFNFFILNDNSCKFMEECVGAD